VLHFGIDAWMSPNHKAYVAVTIHFEEHGVPISMLFDLVCSVCHARFPDEGGDVWRPDLRRCEIRSLGGTLGEVRNEE
jgi:hypothetical protein